jgi:hypothetical protein
MARQSWIRLVFCLAVGPLLAAAEQPSQSASLRVEPSPMKLRGAGVIYERAERNEMTPDDLDRGRKLDYWVEARFGDTIFFPAHLISLDEGLGVYRIGADTWSAYPMFGLAIAAGWYRPSPGEHSFTDGIHGVTVGAGRVWMGTIGLGIVARDLLGRRWSRYDVKWGVMPGIHSSVFHADDEYVFAMSGGPSGDWETRLPDVTIDDLRPALHVYSLRRDARLRVRAVPRENVVTFGWMGDPGPGGPYPAIWCDTRHYARTAYMSLEMCTWPRHVEAAPSSGGYLLVHEFNDAGAPLRFTITKDQLAKAFDSLRGPG